MAPCGVGGGSGGKGAPWTVGINGKNRRQPRWALRSAGRSHVGSVWLVETACRFGGGAGRLQGSPPPAEGGTVVLGGIPNPGLPAKPPPELRQCLSGWVLDAAASATETKPGRGGFLQGLNPTSRRFPGAPGLSVLALKPVLRALASLHTASWLLSIQFI